MTEAADLLAVSPAVSSPVRRLPLVTLYLTERCNSRCVTCDYWQHGRADVGVELVERLLPELAQMGTRVVVLSGGEPLLHPQWAPMAELLKSRVFEVWLLTSGLSLAKYARPAASLFEDITVSMDGTEARTYAAIRGLDAFDKVCQGIRAVASLGKAPSLRVTLQRSNYRELPRFVELAKRLGARRVSFLAVDVANSQAFGRGSDFSSAAALLPEDLPVFEGLLESLEREHAEEFRSGFIAESPQKLRRILQYFTALQGLGAYPSVRCNAPEFSAVVAADGRVQPCFFIGGPVNAPPLGEFYTALNSPDMTVLREHIRAGKRTECKTCVCFKWRELGSA
jgi:MoaA/NifB/PqqE/SkfB family radical SAM enzyme